MENQTNNEAYYNRVVTAALRVGFVALLFLLSYVILKPFLLLVVWSIIIAVGIFPLFEKLTKLLGGKAKLASTIIILVGLAIIIIPSVLLTSSTVESVKTVVEKFENGENIIPPPPAKVAQWPIVGKSVYDIWKLGSEDLETALETFKPHVETFLQKTLDTVMGLGGMIFFFIIAVIIAGVLLLQSEAGEKTTAKIFRLLIGHDSEEITKLVVLTIRSVVQGILGIAFIQSFFAGVLMLAFGIPGAGLWALLVLMLAIMQLPPTIILLPVAIYGFTIMGTTSAVIFLILALLVSVADTFLKPIFLGRGVDVPMLVVLLGAIGGMIVFGILGLFVGAVILAITYKVFQALIDDTVWIGSN
jgi:predicted PurR-regulated permease PerM